MNNISEKLQEESLRRMRWKLWFAFRDTGYEEFRCVRKNGKVEPFYEGIKKYCREHWGKEIGDMTARELSKYIGIVTKW